MSGSSQRRSADGPESVVVDMVSAVLSSGSDRVSAILMSGTERVLVVDLAEPASPLDGIAGTRLVATEAGGLRQRLAFSPADATAATVLAAVSEVAEARDLSVEEPQIEDVVRELYRRALERPNF